MLLHGYLPRERRVAVLQPRVSFTCSLHVSERRGEAFAYDLHGQFESLLPVHT